LGKRVLRTNKIEGVVDGKSDKKENVVLISLGASSNECDGD